MARTLHTIHCNDSNQCILKGKSLMKKPNIHLLIAAVLGMFLLSSCTGIPTLPPLDSTITIEFPRKTAEVTPAGTAATVVHVTVDPPPATQPADTGQPTQTRVPSDTPAPTLTGTPTQTPTDDPTETAAPTQTPTRTFTPAPTATPTGTPFPYGFQDGSPYYLGNFAHPEEGCDWMGVAGQIFDQKGEIITDVVVKAGGSLDGEPIMDPLSMPGAAKVYGPGGYEILLSRTTVASEGDVWVQLFDLDANPVTGKKMITTYDNCRQNLILLNFVRK